ncbi:MAG TPA: alpha/beta hydrolase, partial [Mycobacterium sp.]
QPLTVPTTCIYSKTDGIVAWQCCISLPAPRTENVEVHSSHLGYGHNLETLYVVADRLAQPEDCWQPFQR